MNSKALVTLAVGRNYLDSFDALCRPSWEQYAARHGYDLVVFDEPLDRSRRAASRSASWQKCLILCEPCVQKYREVVWIDCDIIINAAAPPIPTVSPGHFGAVEVYSSPSREIAARRLSRLYGGWRRTGVRFIEEATPEDYYRSRDLPAHSGVCQGGVIVASPEHHREAFLAAYQYEEKGGPEWNYEMGPLSHELLSRHPVTWLDGRFNQVVGIAMQDYPAALIDSFLHRLPHPSKRLARALYRRTAQKWMIRNAVRAIHNRSWFTHFAACREWMRYV